MVLNFEKGDFVCEMKLLNFLVEFPSEEIFYYANSILVQELRKNLVLEIFVGKFMFLVIFHSYYFF
jgi:hypothetical protein